MKRELTGVHLYVVAALAVLAVMVSAAYETGSLDVQQFVQAGFVAEAEYDAGAVGSGPSIVAPETKTIIARTGVARYGD